jgi:hypothetical protein
MSKPDKGEFDLGDNIYGQPVKLIKQYHYGQKVWEIYRGQANQRDDTRFIGGLTDEIILKMIEAVKSNP